MSETKSPNREFFLNSEITANSVERVILGIYEINKFDDEQSQKLSSFKREPIKIVTDSFGGCCYSGMALVNSIDTSATPVHTFCYGKSMSMALTIFASGHIRFAHKRATFMQHQLSGGSSGSKLNDIVEDGEQKVILQNMMDEVLIESSKIERSTLLEYRDRKKDWYFTGEEALKLGVVDELIARKREVESTVGQTKNKKVEL